MSLVGRPSFPALPFRLRKRLWALSRDYKWQQAGSGEQTPARQTGQVMGIRKANIENKQNKEKKLLLQSFPFSGTFVLFHLKSSDIFYI